MKFTVAGSKIVCGRIDKTVEEGNTYRPVVEFDLNIDSVPPHVAERLTQGEIEELEHFLADRRRIKAGPADKLMLEALPGLLNEATEILDSVDQVSAAMYKQLITSVGCLWSALDNAKPATNGHVRPDENMRDSKAQEGKSENTEQES